MNILFITHHDNFQGSSRSLFSLVEALCNYQVNPFVIVTAESAFTDRMTASGIPFKILPVPWWMTRKSWSPSNVWKFQKEARQSLKALHKVVNKWEIDLIYSNSSVFPIGRMLAMKHKIPHVWHVREFGDLHYSFNFIFPKWLCQRYIRTSQAVICNSQAVRKHVFNSWTTEKLHVIYNGVATKEQFDQLITRAQTRSQNGPYTFLFIGSMSPRKGPEVAIRATAELISRGLDVKLLIAGSGREDFINHCRGLVESLGISAYVEFTGFISDPYDAYFNSDCLLMCSEYEAFGRVTAEAMSACLPVIGKNSGGTPEIIVDGQTGYLYDTPAELAARMSELAQNRPLSRELGQAGWERARERFSIDDYSENIHKILQLVSNS